MNFLSAVPYNIAAGDVCGGVVERIRRNLRIFGKGGLALL